MKRYSKQNLRHFKRITVKMIGAWLMASVGLVAGNPMAAQPQQLPLITAPMAPQQLSAAQYAQQPQIQPQYATQYTPQTQIYTPALQHQQQPFNVLPRQLPQQQQPSVDSMQQNLKVLLNYLNDEPMTGASAAGTAQPPAQATRLFPRSAGQQSPANVLVTMTPMGWNPQQLGGTFAASPPAQYGQKVRRMAEPSPVQPVGANLLNFMQNDAAGANLNYLNSVFLRPQNDVELPDGGDEEGGPSEDPDDGSDGPVDEGGAPLKFSKLGKPVDGGAKPVTGNPLKGDPKVTAKPVPTLQTPKPTQISSPAKAPTPTAVPTASGPVSTPGNTPDKIASGMVGLGGGGLGAGIISPQNQNGQVVFGNGMDTNNSPRPPSLLPQNGQLPMIIPQQQKIGDPFGERVTPPSAPAKFNFKLIYFDARGICEPIRLLFHYAKVPFEDARITRRQWLALKDSTIYGKVPILEVDGKPLTYCHTISRFLARTFGLAGSNSWEQAKVDEISDFHSDVAMDLQPYLYVVAGFHQGDREALRKAIFLPGVEKHFQVYVNLLKQSGSGFFVQSGLTWIDFVISEYMTTIKHFEPAILDKYPALTKFIRKVQSLPQIFDYIANREHQPV